MVLDSLVISQQFEASGRLDSHCSPDRRAAFGAEANVFSKLRPAFPAIDQGIPTGCEAPTVGLNLTALRGATPSRRRQRALHRGSDNDGLEPVLGWFMAGLL